MANNTEGVNKGSKLDDKVSAYLADIFRKEVAKMNLDDEEQQNHEESFYTLLRQNEFGKIKERAAEMEDQYDIDLSEIKSFVEKATDDDLIETDDNRIETCEMDEGTANAIKVQVSNIDADEVVVETNEPVSVEELFSLQDGIYKEYDKKAFIISNQHTWNGRVSVELSGKKESIQLLRVYKTDDKGLEFRHLGESNTKHKGKKVVDQHTHGFFIYKFESDNREYLLFSREKLDPMNCEVSGMVFRISDFKEIGDNTGMPVDRDIIFAQNVEPAIKSLSDEKVEEMEPKIDHEWLATKLLGDWRHPEWFEKLLLTMDMVNEEHGFPSGLLWMAEPGTGKSVTLEAMADAHAEKEGVHTGSASTIKGLTPSFAQMPPDEGYLLKTTRLSAIDEVFNLLSSARNSNNNNMKDAFRPLLDLIEHQDRNFSSGKGSIRGKMESMMIGAGNDSYGINSIYEAAEKLDPAFLSRFLLYEQTPQHIQFIEDRKYEIDEQEASGPDGDPEFISLIDHLKSKEDVSVDSGKVRAIKKDLEDQVPSNFESIYRSRYDHHIKNLVSGHSKYRSLISGSLDFEAKEEDYEFAHDTLEILINSWVVKSNMEQMSVKARPYYLQKHKREIYERICDEYPVTQAELSEMHDGDVGFAVKELRELDVVKLRDERLYPYFADEVEVEGNKKFSNINNGKEEQDD